MSIKFLCILVSASRSVFFSQLNVNRVNIHEAFVAKVTYSLETCPESSFDGERHCIPVPAISYHWKRAV